MLRLHWQHSGADGLYFYAPPHSRLLRFPWIERGRYYAMEWRRLIIGWGPKLDA